MMVPVIQGVIERRLLVNFRADPAVSARLLPPPFEPLTTHGYAMVGICLIRLRGIRPRFVPSACGIRSENAAHRIAVRWTHNSQSREGVYIPRRDTSSRLNALAGGRLFPGVHRRADFDVTETTDSLSIRMTSRDGRANVAVTGQPTRDWPESSIFANVSEASEFFQRGSLGYSARPGPGIYDGLELRCREWTVEPLAVQSVRSSFFENAANFPAGSINFDCALVMRNIAHEWHGRGQMCCDAALMA
jgi:hypothetical protein